LPDGFVREGRAWSCCCGHSNWRTTATAGGEAGGQAGGEADRDAGADGGVVDG